MKNYIIFFVSLFSILYSLFFLSVTMVLAAPDIGIGPGGMASNVAGTGGFETNVTDTTLSENVGRIIRVILSLTGTVFLILTVYAGILWMTAGGNDERVEKAQKIIRSSVVGLIIVVAAYSLTAFILMGVFRVTEPGAGQVGQSAGAQTGGFWQGFGKGFTGSAKNFWSNLW
ncbi:hypothetical protein EPN28_00630 [Patescibacteria group bacterium]|nr:MAG: hypothetical protein EPN28_00630 [Patescibacteria group bacterium]